MFIDLLVVGGGAAGFFTAITCAEASSKSVLILEKTSNLLQKVKISGGGRCNVTHDCVDPRELSGNYPRGQKSLIGPFNRFGPAETVEWFTSRGVELKTEADGRMFPVSDSSQTIVNTLLEAAETAGVSIRTSEGVTSIVQGDRGFEVETDAGNRFTAGCVMIATGGTRLASGAKLASDLGHSLQPATPSLFTFKIDDPRTDGLEGLSVDDVDVKIQGSKLKSSGPVLITHWGMSGPGILKISAWGARELAERDYRFDISVNWLPGVDPAAVFAEQRVDERKRQLSSRCPFPAIPKRLWVSLLDAAGIPETTTWSELGKQRSAALVRELTDATFSVDGKSTNKAEFVTCGGVALKELNFQNAWTNGFQAGTDIAAR